MSELKEIRGQIKELKSDIKNIETLREKVDLPMVNKTINELQEQIKRIVDLEKTNKERWQLIKTQNEVNLKNKKEIASLGDDLQKAGVKWDFRLDEQGGFIDELKEDFNKLKQLIPIEWQQKENTKQLNELKEWKKEHIEKQHGLLQEWGEEQTREINELKEGINTVADSSGNFEDMLLTKTNLNTKILRDSIDFSNLLLELFLDAEILDEENHQRAYKEIKNMLAKLDSGKVAEDSSIFLNSPDMEMETEKKVTGCVGICGFCDIKDTCDNPKRLKQTEKKEYDPICLGEELAELNQIKNEEKRYYAIQDFINEEIINASGGEKKSDETTVVDGFVREARSGDDSKPSDSLTKYRNKVLEPFDSKPPEPKYTKCEDCWFTLCAKNCVGHGCYKGKLKEDRLPGGTGKEPREDEERNWSEDWKEYMRERIKKIFPNEDLVKREDLQFLIKMAKLGCDMNFDFDADGYKNFRRIKEMYRIE